MAKPNDFVCPVCGYPGLDDPPHDEHGCGLFGKCPSCGSEFSYQESASASAALRAPWVAGGMKWQSKKRPPPPGWNPKKHLERLPGVL